MIRVSHPLRAIALFAGVVALLALAPRAHAIPPPAYGIDLSQQLFGDDGDPLLVANFNPDGELATPSWAVCPPGVAPGPGACAPAGVTNQVFRPGPTAVGTPCRS